MKIKPLIVLVSSAVFLATAGAAIASLANSYEVVYFSDASKTRIVGHQNFLCSGAKPVTGVATIYSEEQNVRQCGSGGGFECPGSTGCFTDKDAAPGKWWWDK